MPLLFNVLTFLGVSSWTFMLSDGPFEYWSRLVTWNHPYQCQRFSGWFTSPLLYVSWFFFWSFVWLVKWNMCNCHNPNSTSTQLKSCVWHKNYFRPLPTTHLHHTNSMASISQLFLTWFWPNFKGRFLGPFWTDSNCHSDICPGNICPGDICPGAICPYQEYLSCY